MFGAVCNADNDGSEPMPDERSPKTRLRASTNAHRVRQMWSLLWPFDGGSRVACAHAAVPRRLVISAADSCPRAVRADHEPCQHARRPRRRLSAGDMVSGKNDGNRRWLHCRRALVRRCRRPQPRLGLLEVSLDTSSEPGPHGHIFGRSVLGCPLSIASVVFRATTLEQLGNAILPAAGDKAALSARCLRRAPSRRSALIALDDASLSQLTDNHVGESGGLPRHRRWIERRRGGRPHQLFGLHVEQF